MSPRRRPGSFVHCMRFGLTVALGCSSAGLPGRSSGSVLDDPSCPLLVPETTLTVEATQAGPSFVFVTTGDVEEVRRRGEALAAMHNDREGPPGAMGVAITGTSSAVAVDVAGGVRVTYRPADPNDAGKLGDELRMRAGHLAGASSCVP